METKGWGGVGGRSDGDRQPDREMDEIVGVVRGGLSVCKGE